MDIQIKKIQADKIGIEALAEFGCDTRNWWRGQTQHVNLRAFDTAKLDAFVALIKASVPKKVWGINVILRDIEAWCAATLNASTAKVTTLRAFTPMVIKLLNEVPGHRVYERDHTQWLAHYVNNVQYHPATSGGGYYSPPYVTMELLWHEFGGRKEATFTFYEQDVAKKTVTAILNKAGLYVETPELRATYLAETDRFKKLVNKLGRKYVATGTATYQSDSNNWWSRSETRIQMSGAHVVIDVFKEGTDNNDDSEDEDEDESYWSRSRRRKQKTKVVSDAFWTGRDGDEASTAVEVPIHPKVTVFHLKKHLRITTHVSNLKRYKYDDKLFDKLVIDDTRKGLVKLLIEHRSSKYADIISEKSGGAIVMLCGSPGTGKTLTAEVFAESEKRALYSVQCSQLGVTPEELETELLKVLARAARWNAVLLLDEADVYVHKRGKDVNQNAMVGVFLRVLEYQNAIMFLTTNRAKDIDDAVASRCTAKLVYTNPTYAEQRRIWRVLVDVAKADMDDAVIDAVARANPELSGRDVKNLLKLAMLVSKDQPITTKTITFVKQFKPT